MVSGDRCFLAPAIVTEVEFSVMAAVGGFGGFNNTPVFVIDCVSQFLSPVAVSLVLCLRWW